jgi:hypothetical protein
MNWHTDAVFSALVGLDPLGGSPRADGVVAPAELSPLSEGVAIARIISTPRHEGSAPGYTAKEQRAPGQRRSHLGAGGLVASAAIALLAALLWTSPSAGAPPHQAAHGAYDASHWVPPEVPGGATATVAVLWT